MGRISDDDKKATAEVQSLISQVKLQVEGQLNGIFDTFEAVTYKTQTVAGRNYFVKVHVGDENYLHLRIYQNLQREVSLSNVQADKTLTDAIEYF